MGNIQMKGLHISDVHGDQVALATVRNFANEKKDLEFVVLSGDYAGRCLEDEQIKEEKLSYNFIKSRVKTGEYVPFEAILQHLLSEEEVPEELKKAAGDYKEVLSYFDDRIKSQYKGMKDILNQFEQSVLTIPGNWDTRHYFEYFKDFDIHNKSRVIDGMKFSGYGGNNWVPVVMPEIRHMGISEKELHDFLVKEDPDVAVVHTPPIGLQDDENARGSFANLAYIRAEAPMLFLCGHAHNGYGIGKDSYQSTLIVNSGNLGAYPGSKNQGTFYEIDIGEKGVNKIIPYKIFAGEVLRDEETDSVNGDLRKECVEGVE